MNSTPMPFLARAATLVAIGISAAHAAPALYTAGTARHASRLPDGSTIVVGNFEAVNEVPRAGLAKLAADGSLDSVWAPPGVTSLKANQAVALAASPDGAVLYLATSNTVQAIAAGGTGATVPGFVVTVSGSVDGGNSGIRDVAVDSNGRIYLAGAFAYVNGQARNGLARLTSAGDVDATWNAGANSTVAALAIDASAGFLYAAGSFVTMNSAAHTRVARLQLSDGAVDANWAPLVASTTDGVHRLVLSPTADSVVVSGGFTAVNGVARTGVARVSTANGTVDANWNPPVQGYDVLAIVAASDFVYLAGDSGCCYPSTLVRVQAAGTGALDQNWSAQTDGTVRALLAHGAGAIDAFGDFGYAGNEPALAAATLSTIAGAAAPLADFERQGSVLATASEASGSVLLAGDFLKLDQIYRPRLLRLTAAGAVDEAFVPPRFEGGSLLAIASDASSGDVYVGGEFAKAGGNEHDLVVRLDGVTGDIDPTWAPAINAAPYTGSVQAMAVDGNSALYIGGLFSTVGGQPRANIARLTPAGALDPMFAAATNGAVTRIAVNADDVFIAGTFLSPRTRIAKLHASDGSVDAAWNPAFPWTGNWTHCFDLERVGTGVVVSNEVSVGFLGGFVVVGEIVQIDGTGQVDIVARFNQPVFDILPARDGMSIYIAGLFQSQYAVENLLQQTALPEGLAQISLRPGTYGVAESWLPGATQSGGVPSLTFIGNNLMSVLAGSKAPSPYDIPRGGLDFIGLPAGNFVFKDGFE